MLRTTLWVTYSLSAMILVVAGCGSPPPVEPESIKATRASYDGYYLAVPATPMPDLPRQVVQPLYQIKQFGLDLEIGKNGKIRRVYSIDSVPPAGWNELAATLKRMQFYPGRINDRAVRQTLRATLTLGPERYHQNILFPVDSLGRVANADLYWLGLRMNSVPMPSLDLLQSYFADIDLKDTSNHLNYLLVRLDLDSSGRMTSCETIHSDAGQYTNQIIDALNWSDFTVPRLSGDFKTSVYVRIALYKLVPYPTIKLEFPVVSESMPERERVKLFPDSAGLMFEPVPVSYPKGGLYSTQGGRLDIADTVNALISIGANGLVTSLNPVGSIRSQINIYLKLAKWLKFYPALDFRGEARSFSGIIRLEYNTSAQVRIRFLWLSGQAGTSQR